jgi:hypothetical protein
MEKQLYPTLLFTVKIEHTQYQQGILSVEGWLKAKDGMLLARLTEKPMERRQEIWARGTNTENLITTVGINVELVGQLDSISLERINNDRINDPLRDVNLKLELRVALIESSATVAHLFATPPPPTLGKVDAQTSAGPKEAKLVLSTHDSHFVGVNADNWILSGRGGPSFLNVRTIKEECAHRIRAADWLADYTPKLGLGKYITLEIPSDGEMFQECMSHLSKAEEAFMRWDAKGVFSNCREIGSLLDKRLEQSLGAESFAYKERWGRGFNHWASLDLHNEEIKNKYPTQDVSAKKSDAEVLLLTTKIMMKFAQELLEEAKEKR